ncbi:endonuclease G, mitochondrial [Bufo gargarizans]|uniref:endonuclease G, mitochondrial n=1 Tax=Bufo gargarizans TaxID=30331 RepID=UPI001CF14595|nr:endonuclease G, mitochondrial [Bufo gargarizans]
MRRSRSLLLSGASLAVGVALGAGLTSWKLKDEAAPKILYPPIVQAASEVLLPSPSGIARFGLPGLSQLKTRQSHVLSYDARLRGPAWVLEQLNGERLQGSANRQGCDFIEDESVHPYHQATNADYRGSGFDRGHLAAAANHRWSQKAMDETFILSNIYPQNPNLNQNAWNNLEKYCRGLTRSNKNVYVCTGPLFLPKREVDGKMYVKYQVIGANHVAVPTHFFKVVVLEKYNGEIELRPYVMPNCPVDEKIPLDRFLVPIESIERASGLLFVPNILKSSSNLKAITAGGK